MVFFHVHSPLHLHDVLDLCYTDKFKTTSTSNTIATTIPQKTGASTVEYPTSEESNVKLYMHIFYRFEKTTFKKYVKMSKNFK